MVVLRSATTGNWGNLEALDPQSLAPTLERVHLELIYNGPCKGAEMTIMLGGTVLDASFRIPGR